MIVANSIGAIIITVICVIGITLLLKDIFGWKENDAIKIGMVVTFTYWIVLFIFLIYCLVQWILFQNKCQKTEEQLNLTNERERERERRIINWAATY
jgi:membrane protein implicated in regulation of membrane protease activity